MNPVESLQKAFLARDGDAVEEALLKCLDIGEVADYISLLARLILEDWHFKHEDIALELQRLRPPSAIRSLSETAKRKFEYLDHDDSHALARKCTWALADIGTDEAKRELEILASFHDTEVAAYAQKRLVKWESETKRKRKNTTS